MASRYDELDPRTELEQFLARDLKVALEGRGCEVFHHGANNGGRHSPGGKPDIEIRDRPNGRLILVEVTKRVGSAAEGEFIAVTDHLQRAIAAGGYSDYGVLYISPRTSARISSSFRDLFNRARARANEPGRVVALDFAAAEMMVRRLAEASSDLFPASRLGDLLERWEEAGDDALARLLVVKTLFPEDAGLLDQLSGEAEEFGAARERKLKKQLENIETALRDRGVTGDGANQVLIYLAFLRLYEERRQILTGEPSRFTAAGFEAWRSKAPATVKNRYSDRMVEALLHEIAEDPDLIEAGLLRDHLGNPSNLHRGVKDSFVVEKLLPVLDEYDFQVGRVDVLGAVFETLARKAQKDTRVGQFFTPQPVVDFAASMVPLTPKDVVLDPAVGTARFLIRAMTDMAAAAGTPEERSIVRSQRLLGADIDGWVATIAKMNMFIHGDGKTNIVEGNGLVLGDRSLFQRYPDGLSGVASVVMTNPPLGDVDHGVAVEDWRALGSSGVAEDLTFLERLGVVPLRVIEEKKLSQARTKQAEVSREIEELEAALPDEEARKRLAVRRKARDRWTRRVIELESQISSGRVTHEPTTRVMKGGALFLGAIADYLQPVRDSGAPPEWRGGWAAVVVDEAILNTADYGSVRSFIRERFYVKAVVSLGRQAFQYLAHTSAKTSLLFLTKKPEPGKAQVEPVFYAHAERVGYGPTGRWVGDDLPKVLQTFGLCRAALQAAYLGSWVSPESAMAAVEGVDGFADLFFTMPIGGGPDRLDFFNARYARRLRELEARHGDLRRLGDYIDPVIPERPDPDRSGKYPLAEISRINGIVRPKQGVESVSYSPSQLWKVREGMLVVSGIDAVNGAVAVAGPDVDGLVMSEEMYGFALRDAASASAIYLQLLVRSQAAREMLEGITTGTSNRTRLEGPEQLLNLPMPPLPPLTIQNQIAETFLHAARGRAEADLAQEKAKREVASHWDAGVAGEGTTTPVTD